MEFSNKLSRSLETVGETDYLVVILNLVFCIISSFILMYVYRNKANSLSSKIQISFIIPLLSNITFLVILIVKSSLALSLGLVGALSVIRFRTPIKEPEDLAFLFFAIALGIGYGALQLYSTSIIFLILIAIIWVFLSRRSEKLGKNFNLMVECNSSETQKYFDEILESVKTNCNEAELVKVEKQDNITMIFFKVSFEKTIDIKSLISNLEKNFDGIKFSLYENKTLD
tara:strand:+ start:1055 stop:1738 length:684 start_codon:yes stop_codon:yes gene_type:complete